MLKWFSNNLKWLNNPQMYVCLILALVFWGVNRLNGMYTSDITIPVTISGVGDNDLIIDESQLDVKLKIKANGYTIMFFKVVSPQSMFDFSVADIELERSKDSLFFEISHTSMRNILQQKFGSKAEIIDVQNNSLTVGAKRYRQKTLPIIPRLSLDFGGEFMQVGKTVLDPCSVIVGGTTPIIDTMTYVFTDNVTVNTKNNNLAGNVKLVTLPSVVYSETKVNYTIDCERYTELNEVCKVQVINFESKPIPNLISLPFEVEVKFYITKKAFNVFSKDDIFVYVEYDPDKFPHNDLYMVKYTCSSSNIKVVDISPRFITLLKH